MGVWVNLGEHARPAPQRTGRPAGSALGEGTKGATGALEWRCQVARFPHPILSWWNVPACGLGPEPRVGHRALLTWLSPRGDA